MTTPRGLLTPFQRDRKRDFASGERDDLLASKVEQVLATEGSTLRSTGELPWRTAFGTPLGVLRHQRNEVVLGELARVYIRDALAWWVPEATLVAVEVQREGGELRLRVRFQAAGQERTASLSLG
jgi:phage gp46-like protein